MVKFRPRPQFPSRPCQVVVKGKVVLAGEFHERVNAEESVWNLEDKTKVPRAVGDTPQERGF